MYIICNSNKLINQLTYQYCLLLTSWKIEISFIVEAV